MQRIELYQRGRRGQAKVWIAEQAGNAVVVRWGQVDGQLQETTQTFEPVNAGRADELSATEVAANWLEHQRLLRERKGYVTNLEQAPAADLSRVDLFGRPPLNLRFFKPQNTMGARLEQRLEEGGCWALRKRDGLMCSVHIDEQGAIRIFSSTMSPGHQEEPGVPWTDRFPHIVRELQRMGWPPRTILLGELCTVNRAGVGFYDEDHFDVDHFDLVGSVCRSLTERALELQEVTPLGLCLWDIAFLDGVCLLQEMSANSRFIKLIDKIKRRKFAWVTHPEILTLDITRRQMNLRSANAEEDWLCYPLDGLSASGFLLQLAKRKGWEGFVIIEAGAKYDDRAFNLRGKAERPATCAKLKPKLDGDFIVRWAPDQGIGTRGKGKKSAGVGALAAYLMSPAGEEVYICDVGGGLSDELVVKLADPTLYPLVAQVEFDSWTVKGALRFPTFLRLRDDKQLAECSLDQRPASVSSEE